MIPSFNTAGPCVPGEHYMLPPARRFAHVVRLVEEGKYFTVHAGRQTGKTTSARWLVDHLNSGDRFCAAWVDIQTAREEPDRVKAFREVLLDLDRAVRRDLPQLGSPGRDEVERWLESTGSTVLEYLQYLCARAPRPLVIFFDEADGLVGDAMVSFLTQLRTGYVGRSTTPFPQSIALVGQRQVRDYVVATEDRRAVAWLGTASPFNVTAEAATLEPFSAEDVTELLDQHTAQTRQAFTPEATALIYDLSRGHPWLVNAIADQIVNRDVEDRSVAVTPAHVEAAKETIIVERRSHIDSLVARLREPRVRRIIEPMLTGDQTGDDVLDDDFSYVRGLGLIALRDGRHEIANPIYKEVVPRALTWLRQTQIWQEPAWYVRADGTLDVRKLVEAFQDFWREDGHLAAEGFAYREAGPHLMMMAFLQRIVNSGGRVEREYGLGKGALDLVVHFGGERHVFELKLRRDTRTSERGIRQLCRYLDHLGLSEGWLVLFDLRKDQPWEERIFLLDEAFEGKIVHIVGC
jgi:hypothetical protein